MECKWIAHGSNNDKAKINLLCFPYPGGSAGGFAKWKFRFSDEINVCPVLYPMRERRRKENLPDSFVDFVDTFIKENTELFNKDFAIFGYCAGAAIGFEVAVKIRELTGKDPVYFMAASSEAPAYVKDSAIISGEENKNEAALKYLRSLDVFDEETITSSSFMKYYLPILIADAKLLGSYEASNVKSFGFNLDIAIGVKDKSINTCKAEEWKNVTNGSFEIYKYDAGHFFVDDNLEDICVKISKKLLK